MKTWGFDLINYTNGGDGCTFGNQTSFKKGHQLWLGKKHSEESKKKIGENNFFNGKPAFNRKVVIQLSLNDDFIKEWEYIELAAIETNSSKTKIVAVCKGKRKTHNNFKWKYK